MPSFFSTSLCSAASGSSFYFKGVITVISCNLSLASAVHVVLPIQSQWTTPASFNFESCTSNTVCHGKGTFCQLSCLASEELIQQVGAPGIFDVQFAAQQEHL